MSEANAGGFQDKPGEECGVFGIYAPGEQVEGLAYQALQILQHRGQQGAGISVSDGETVRRFTGLGSVKEAFMKGSHLSGLQGDNILATGHTRYGTTKTDADTEKRALQPMHFFAGHTEFTLAHNGHVDGLDSVAREFGAFPGNVSTDSELMLRIIGAEHHRSGKLQEALRATLPHFLGAYSLVLSTKDQLVAARDPNGIRPLHLGRLDVDRGWVLASEIGALTRIKARPIREIEPGEILTISGCGESDLSSEQFAPPRLAICAFEGVYFSRTDNILGGESVLDIRERSGMILARRNKVEADMVIGVPESSVADADGFAWESGIRHVKALIKNLHTDRSFTGANQNMREDTARSKYSIVASKVNGKRVIVIDDSLVRGTTTRVLVEMFREAGAAEVHLKIASPPYKHPCHLGMDTGRREELLAANMSIEEMRVHVGADSLDFLTNEELKEALGSIAGNVCTGCTTGIYPVTPPAMSALLVL